MTQKGAPKVSEHDREYMRRLGQYVAEANEAARQEWLALPGAERLARSFALSRRGRDYAHPNRDKGDPSLIYTRARALGLIR